MPRGTAIRSVFSTISDYSHSQNTSGFRPSTQIISLLMLLRPPGCYPSNSSFLALVTHTSPQSLPQDSSLSGGRMCLIICWTTFTSSISLKCSGLNGKTILDTVCRTGVSLLHPRRSLGILFAKEFRHGGKHPFSQTLGSLLRLVTL